MIETASPTLVLIAVIAVICPLLADRLARFNVPDVVLELAFGILVGPWVLNIAHPHEVVNGLANIGLAFLMFLAGFELDLQRMKGRPLRLGVQGWLVSLALAMGLAFALVQTGLALDTLIVGLALTTTALGTLLPMLGDAGALDGPFGPFFLGAGSAGEFGPIVAVAILLTKKDPLIATALLIAFVAVAVVGALLATRERPPRVVAVLARHLHSSAQLPVRIAVLLVFVLVFFAFKLGLDVLLGAFAAGVLVRLFTIGEDSPVIKGKLEAIGFGFLIPIFFVVSGIRFNLHVLISSPSALLRVPLFLALFLVVRGLPSLLLYRNVLPKAERIPFALFASTGLPLIVVITDLGVSLGRMRPENAAALVGAGMLSVLIFPMLGLNRLRRAGVAATPDEADGADGVDGADPTAQAADPVPPDPSGGEAL